MSTAPQMDALSRLPDWQRERCGAMHDACTRLAALLDAGNGLEAAMQMVRTERAGALVLDANGNRVPMPLSDPTLKRALRAWRAGGRHALAFAPKYNAGSREIPGELITELRRQATMPGVESFSVAINVLRAAWRDGKPVPGLGTWAEWWREHRPAMLIPEKAPEFPYSTRALYNYAPPKAQRALGNRGKAAARKLLPFLDRDYSKLRPAELYVLDDVRLDLLAIDDTSKMVTEVVGYLMMDVASRMICGWVLRPANAIQGCDVDALIARVLHKSGIGVDYPTHILLERGTVAMTEAGQKLLERATGGRVLINRTAMIYGKRWPGAPDDVASGNWMGKSVIESFMRKLHLSLMHLPGQRGSDYSKQPANLGWTGQRDAEKRAKAWPPKSAKGTTDGEHEKRLAMTAFREAELLANISLVAGQRVRLSMPFLWVSQLNEIFRAVIRRHNESHEHAHKDCHFVTEAEVMPGVWRPVES